MFTKTKDEQLDIFREVSVFISPIAKKKLEDKSSWNQVVYNNFVSKVDESIYSVLYTSRTGRPNSSIRVLLAMMLLKEMNGWSDEQLFDECMFNLRVRAALGIRDVNKSAPVASTYYDFRCKLARHLQNTETFNQVCASQLEDLEISGTKIRMDSKLIQSNIARQNRLQLIVETLRVSIKKITLTNLESHLKSEQYEILTSLNKKSTSNITYPLSKCEKEKMLQDCGEIISVMIGLGLVKKGSILYRVFEEQYEKKESKDADDNEPKIGLKSPSKIGSGTIQSVHDADAAYRKKGNAENVKTVKGYHSNITETCDEADKPNIITNVITTPANINENEYLEEATKASQQNLGADKKIEQVITDGGYDALDNREAMQQQDAPSWKMPNLKGPQRVYKMAYDDQDNLEVKDSKTDEVLELRWAKRANKYKVKNKDGSTRYFTKAQVKQYIQALEILANTNDNDYNLRANVESTIHEVFHRLGRRHKIRYRGMTEKVLEKAILIVTALIKVYKIWKMYLPHMHKSENFILQN